MTIRAIAAMNSTRTIGLNGSIPWYVPADLKRFRSLTYGGIVVMGRKTFESLKQPLRDRLNVVISTTLIDAPREVMVLPSVEKVMQTFNDFWVIGGQSIYEAFLPHTDEVYLTLVKNSTLEGDRVFPIFEHNFIRESFEDSEVCSYQTYKRIQPRPDWDTYFFNLAQLVATRSTCLAQQVGAVIVKDKRVLATGYNGVPPGHDHCRDRGFCHEHAIKCTDNQSIPSPAIHAEINAIAQAAQHGIAIAGATLYCTHPPCRNCQKAITAAGITTVYTKE